MMTFVPLLRVQRELYAMPRGMERFREYIKTMVDAETGDLALPLVAMNPMGKDHVPALIDDYLTLGAEQIAEEAVRSVHGAGSSSSARLRNANLEEPAATNYDVVAKRGWLVGLLWSSEPASAQNVRDAVLTSIHRAEYLQAHAAPATLGEMLDQEGYAMARAGCTTPQLDDDDLAYTRSVITPHHGATDRATVIACMFGDRAAAALGYPPQGLSDHAGLAMALSSARSAISAISAIGH